MTVKNLIKELLEMPLDVEVQIAFQDDDYQYQNIVGAVYYDDDDTVGIVGNRN